MHVSNPSATCLLIRSLQAATHRRRLHEVSDTAVSPAYYADAVKVAGILLQSTDPGAGWASAGDNGVYIAVANQPGRNYKGLVPAALAVGPVRDATGTKSNYDVTNNVAVRFSEGLLGSCTDENGAEITATDSCVVPTVAIYATNPANAVDAAAPTDSSMPDGFAPVSGVVTLRVGGADTGALPCTAPGCTASLRAPVTETATPSMLYQCFQVVAGQIKLSTDAVASPASRAIEVIAGQAPTFTCDVKQAGSYLVGRYPDPNYKAGVPEHDYSNIPNLVSGSPNIRDVGHCRPQCGFSRHAQGLESTQKCLPDASGAVFMWHTERWRDALASWKLGQP
jgi:hypothetical protein